MVYTFNMHLERMLLAYDKFLISTDKTVTIKSISFVLSMNDRDYNYAPWRIVDRQQLLQVGAGSAMSIQIGIIRR